MVHHCAKTKKIQVPSKSKTPHRKKYSKIYCKSPRLKKLRFNSPPHPFLLESASLSLLESLPPAPTTSQPSAVLHETFGCHAKLLDCGTSPHVPATARYPPGVKIVVEKSCSHPKSRGKCGYWKSTPPSCLTV